MAGQNSGIERRGSMVHSMAVVLWAAISCILFSIPVFIVSVFSRPAAQSIGRLWLRLIVAVCGLRLQVAGAQQLDPARRYIFIANHQSHLDIPALFSVLPYRLTFIAKRELFLIPFFGWGIGALGHIAIDRSNARKARESFSRAVLRLQREDISLVLFPEGTRSSDGAVGPFKRGSFALALESGLPIVPVAIDGTRAVLPKKGKRITPGSAGIRIGMPIDAAAEGISDKSELAARVRNAIIGMGLPEGTPAAETAVDDAE
jgi:1-acyl-sn-glycerol-3-phosphate acyltransferase